VAAVRDVQISQSDRARNWRISNSPGRTYMPDPNKIHKIGDLTVTKIEEQVIPGIPPAYLYPKMSAEEFAAIEPGLAADDLGSTRSDFNVSVHTWLVRTPKHTILVDTGSGNNKEHPQNPLFHRLNLPYLKRLADAGVCPEDVDYVFNTHLHVDHVGSRKRQVDPDLSERALRHAVGRARLLFQRRQP
jgi:hypothetical protein